MPKKGKSYHNFMEKKFYHPTSFRNLERVFIRKKELEDQKKKLVERQQAHRRENEEMETRILMGDKKAKLGVAFIYDEPPGHENQLAAANAAVEVSGNGIAGGTMKHGIHSALLGQGPHGTNKYAPNQVAQYKFEWQKHAPRQKYLNDAAHVDMLNTMPTDKPFGIEVRNVMCIKCKVWGHCATDRDCPFYGTPLKDIPERAEDLAEKRRYLAAKYGESLGDDLEPINREREEQLEKLQKKKVRAKLEVVRKSGQVVSDTRLKKNFRGKHDIGGKKYEVIVSSGDEQSSEEESSSSSGSSSEEEIIKWSASDRERMMARMQEVMRGNAGVKKEKKEVKIKKEEKSKKKSKKEKKEKREKVKKEAKRRHKSDDWEEAPVYSKQSSSRQNGSSSRKREHDQQEASRSQRESELAKWKQTKQSRNGHSDTREHRDTRPGSKRTKSSFEIEEEEKARRRRRM